MELLDLQSVVQEHQRQTPCIHMAGFSLLSTFKFCTLLSCSCIIVLTILGKMTSCMKNSVEIIIQ